MDYDGGSKMSRRFLIFGLFFIFGLNSSVVGAYEGFTTIENPSGGRIVYGPIRFQTSPQSAMGQMLRNIRDEYGEKPKLGKVAHDDTGELLATFFSVTAKTQSDRQVAGLVVVSMPRNGQPRAAVLSDDAKRFPSTLDSMLERLQSVMATPGLR